MGTGKTYSTKYLLDSNNSSGVAGQVLSTTSTGIDWVDGSAIPGVPGGSGTVNTIPLWTPNGDTLGNSVMTQSGVNIGIGTTTYTNSSGYSTLNINGTTSGGGGQIAFQTSGSSKHFIWGTATDFNIYNGQTGPLIFYTGATERMRINASGNVGIGTTSPGSLLTLNGSGQTNNYSGVLRIYNTYSTGAWGHITLPDSLSSTSNSNNYYLIGRANNYTDRIMSFHIPRDDDYGSGAQPKFGFYSTGADLLHSIEAQTGTSYFKGNVGIGTTLPKTSLDIVKDSDIWHLMAGGATKKLLVGGQAVSGDVVLQAGAASTPNNAAVTTAYNLCLQRDGGNVGIAVPSPTAKLHVQGAANDGIAIMGVSTTATRGFLGLDASNHGQMQVISSAAGGGALIKSIGNSYLNGGNVGIGTTSPQSKLQVAGGIQMANDTATASAAKVGTMRYRTGTEYVEVTGTELIANGEFTTDTAWTKGAGWAIANGKATLTAQGASTSLTSTVMTVTSGSIYKVVVDVVSTSTGFRLYDTLGVVSYGLGVGKNTFYRTVSSSSYQVTPLGLSGASGSIESVSVIEVTAEDASYADMCMQTGASTYEWVNIVRNTY